MVRTRDYGPALSRWVLAVAGLLLLAGCTGMPATSPAATGAAPAVLTETTAPAAPSDASAAAAALTKEGSPGATTATASATASAAPSGAASDTPTASPGGERATATAVILATAPPAAPPEPSTVPEAPASPAPAVAPAFACTPGELTPAQTEGPYYTANPPETASLLQPGMDGTTLTISGYVLDADCRPVPGARVDFWQADSQGRYDNRGYTLRGYQTTDAGGRYSMETVVPGLYPGRTSHIHVKVTAPGGPTLTTQLYFPDETANDSDGIYDPRMLLTIERTQSGAMGRYDFVINTK